MYEQPLLVLTAANENYEYFLATSLYSLAMNNQKSVLEITVLHQNISLTSQQRIETLIKGNHTIRWIEVNEKLCKKVGAPVSLSKALPNYFRLLAPYIYPNDERAIYLDADTITLKDLGPLATVSLKNHAIGAVVDWLSKVSEAIANWQELNLNGEDPYFNSGVLVMDLAKWREKSISQKTLEICSKNNIYLQAHGKWHQHEQYGLNVAVQNQWYQLSPIWNHFTERAPTLEKPCILHYVGQGKPWSPLCRPEFKLIFEKMLQQTPWHNWLPK